MISIWPWHPFVHYEFGGVKKQTAMMWFGDQYRVDGYIPGIIVLPIILPQKNIAC